MHGLGKKNLKQQEVDNMSIVENSKQYEFLMKIKDVGMQIVFHTITPEMIIENFAEYEIYIQDHNISYKYINTLQKITEQVDASKRSIFRRYTPDELLMDLGQFTPYIIYDDEEEDKEQTILYNNDESWLYK